MKTPTESHRRKRDIVTFQPTVAARKKLKREMRRRRLVPRTRIINELIVRHLP